MRPNFYHSICLYIYNCQSFIIRNSVSITEQAANEGKNENNYSDSFHTSPSQIIFHVKTL